MKRRRDIEIEGFEEEDKFRSGRILNIFSVELADLPLDILHLVVIQKTSLLERHFLRFVCKNLHHLVYFYSKYLSMKFHYPKGFHALAAKWNNLKVFEWTTSIFGKGNSTGVWYNIAKYGNIQLLNRVKHIGHPLNNIVCLGAAYSGNLENLIWARKNGCQWHEDTCSYAVKKGHFEALRAALARNSKMGYRKQMSLEFREMLFDCKTRAFRNIKMDQ
jgi:hypothetical protein